MLNSAFLNPLDLLVSEKGSACSSPFRRDQHQCPLRQHILFDKDKTVLARNLQISTSVKFVQLWKISLM